MRCTKLWLLVVATVGLVHCKSNPGDSAPRRAEAEPASEAGSPHAGMEAPAGGTVRGTIAEKVDAAGYSYLRLESAGKSTWAAVPSTDAKVGTAVVVENAMLMRNFKSPSLGRDFGDIYFGTLSGQSPPSKPPAATASAAAAKPMTAPPPMASVPAGTAKMVSVAEVLAKPADFQNKPVSIRGAVTKVNVGILDRNWIHVKDGDKSLVVTSKETADVGDTVVATGIIVTARDFGAGYEYPVLMESARFTKVAADAGAAKK